MSASRSPAAVAAGHPAVADAAARILAAGGNAFDAAVGAGMASAVAEPGLTSLAGGGFLLARTADGSGTVFDFFVDTPGRGLSPAATAPHFDEVVVQFQAARQSFHCGMGSVAVPGALTGYLQVHRRLGRLSLAEVIEPARLLARDGVALAPGQAGIFGLLKPILLRTAEGRAIYAPQGTLLRAGETLRNPALGDLLGELAAGSEVSLCAGPVAQALVAASAAGGGLVTQADLDAYEVAERVPLAVRFEGHTILTNPPPSFGGALIVAALEDLTRRGPVPRGAGLIPALGQTMVAIDRRRAEILAAAAADAPRMSRGTTHLSVADHEGNVASMTTSNGECSGHLIPGTGIMLNNMLGEDDLHPDGFHRSPPGIRVASMMAPTVVVGPRGRPELVLGSGGSKRIRSAILQVLARVLVDASPPEVAVAAPRIHWDEDHFEVEPGLPDSVLERLAGLGPVHEWPETSVYFGGVHAVTPGGQAGADPRRDGAVHRFLS